MFLPFTTLMYVFLVQGVGNSVQGLDWLWLFLAALLDIASIGAAGAYQPQSHSCRLSWLVPAGSAAAAAVDGTAASAQLVSWVRGPHWTSRWRQGGHCFGNKLAS